MSQKINNKTGNLKPLKEFLNRLFHKGTHVPNIIILSLILEKNTIFKKNVKQYILYTCILLYNQSSWLIAYFKVLILYEYIGVFSAIWRLKCTQSFQKYFVYILYFKVFMLFWTFWTLINLYSVGNYHKIK